jgi:hypothetical protein
MRSAIISAGLFACAWSQAPPLVGNVTSNTTAAETLQSEQAAEKEAADRLRTEQEAAKAAAEQKRMQQQYMNQYVPKEYQDIGEGNSTVKQADANQMQEYYRQKYASSYMPDMHQYNQSNMTDAQRAELQKFFMDKYVPASYRMGAGEQNSGSSSGAGDFSKYIPAAFRAYSSSQQGESHSSAPTQQQASSGPAQAPMLLGAQPTGAVADGRPSYDQYMDQWVGSQAGGAQGGTDYSKYMKEYSQGTAGADYSQYMHDYVKSPGSGAAGAGAYSEYMDKYGKSGDYSKYMQQYAGGSHRAGTPGNAAMVQLADSGKEAPAAGQYGDYQQYLHRYGGSKEYGEYADNYADKYAGRTPAQQQDYQRFVDKYGAFMHSKAEGEASSSPDSKAQNEPLLAHSGASAKAEDSKSSSLAEVKHASHAWLAFCSFLGFSVAAVAWRSKRAARVWAVADAESELHSEGAHFQLLA